LYTEQIEQITAIKGSGKKELHIGWIP